MEKCILLDKYIDICAYFVKKPKRPEDAQTVHTNRLAGTPDVPFSTVSAHNRDQQVVMGLYHKVLSNSFIIL